MSPTLPLRIPTFQPATPVVQPIEIYERWVKGTIIATYTQAFLNSMEPDDFVTTLRRIFERKSKVFRNLAAHVKREVEEKGRPIQQTLQNISFYAIVMKDYVQRNNNQPILGHT
jgi:hypothetical protein